MDVKAAIRDYIVGRFGTGGLDGLRDDDPLLELGIIDSIKVFQLLAFVESSFGVTLKPSDLTVESFFSIETIARLVEGRISPQKSE